MQFETGTAPTAADAEVYFNIPAGTYNGLQVDVITADGKIAGRKLNTAITASPGLLVPSRSWLNLHSLPLLRSLDVDSYPLVKLFSLSFEPHVIVFSVYGEPKPARPVLVGFELQDDIVGFERMIIPYRVQFSRVSVGLHRK